MSLSAHVVTSRGPLSLDATLDAPVGQVVVLLGPNAAGKSTLLRSLAGLVRLDAGRVLLDGEVLDDPAEGVHVPTESRSVGMMFQDYLLFPHLSALDNIAFGLRTAGHSRREARRRAAEWLERVGVDGGARHHPRALSGGQAQRVALARALAREPRLLLLDEPLAALDAGSRAKLRRELRGHLTSFDGISLVVTHDPIDAMTLGDRLVVLQEGCVTQSGTTTEVTHHPRSRYVAELVGVNLFRGTAHGGVIELVDAREQLVSAEQAMDGDVYAVVGPAAVALYRSRPEGSPRNVWPGTVGPLDVAGDRVRVEIHGPVALVAEVTPAAVAALRLGEGGEVWASVKATEVRVYPA